MDIDNSKSRKILILLLVVVAVLFVIIGGIIFKHTALSGKDTVEYVTDANGETIVINKNEPSQSVKGQSQASSDSETSSQDGTSADNGSSIADNNSNGESNKGDGQGNSQGNNSGGSTVVDNSPASIDVSFNKVNSWESNGKKFSQYTVTVKNTGTRPVSSWSLTFELGDGGNIESCWNCNLNNETVNGKTGAKLDPVDYNSNISVGSSSTDIGFIVSSNDGYVISSCNKTATAGNQQVADNGNNGGSGNNSGNSNSEPATVPDVEALDPPTATGVAYGKLKVSGTSLVDSKGNKVQLRGLSTHGIGWFPQYVNKEAFKTLRDDWGANVVRLAMYPREGSGYLTGGNQAELKKLICDGVEYATELGMYVIIDWHVLAYQPTQDTASAVAFFSEMSKKYQKYDNVIYEICNEPTGSDWNSVIKPYAESVIKAIRANDADAVILVGTNTWSQDVDAVIGNKLSDDNVMYVLHFYAGTHRDDLRNKLIKAYDAGVPIFVSECSICDASGNGGIDYTSATAWINLLNNRGISYISWSLCNKNETSAVIRSDCSKLSGWTVDELSDTGKWFRSVMRKGAGLD